MTSKRFPLFRGVELPDRPVRAIGIDLGTTNSVIAQATHSPGSAGPEVSCLEVVQKTESGPSISTSVPSVVAPYMDMVGEGAKRLRAKRRTKRRRVLAETKNEMGLRRTYPRAPEGCRTPPEVAATILRFLVDAASKESEHPPERTVITVPASFQSAQRRDTVRAAEMAGIDLIGGDLLDEPVAAFIDYVVRHGLPDRPEANLLVFDLGGGTCDVALFSLTIPEAASPKGGPRPPSVAPRAVSRYHRLGGGDIDRAIVHEVLIPQVVSQAGVQANDLNYQDRRSIEEALIGVAEQLKVGLSTESARLRELGQYESRRDTLTSRQHSVYSCSLSTRRSLSLAEPELSALQLEEILQQFLERDHLAARDGEYYRTMSIVAPIEDAIETAGMNPSDVHLCLLAGGSSLTPQVQSAVADVLPAAEMLRYEGDQSVAFQESVARGAAWQALSLAFTGEPLIRPVAGRSLSIRHSGGAAELVPRGAPIPYPGSEEWRELSGLMAPVTDLVPTIRLEILADDSDPTPVYTETWTPPAVVNAGDPLQLGFRLDEHQVLHLRLGLADQPNIPRFEGRTENPLSHVHNPVEARMEIDRIEEGLRDGTQTQSPDVCRTLAGHYQELNHTDQEIAWLHRALRKAHKSRAGILSRLGTAYGRKRDWKRQTDAYRSAADVSGEWKGPLFNLALAQNRRGEYAAARITIDEAMEANRLGPYLVLASKIYRNAGDTECAQAALDEAWGRFLPLSTMSDFQLSWYRHGAELAGDTAKVKEATEEQKVRRGSATKPTAGGTLPDLDE